MILYQRFIDLIHRRGMSDRFRFCGRVGTPEIVNGLMLVQPFNDQESFVRD